MQKGTDTDQILEVLYNYPPDDPDTASAYASIVTLCVCEAHICTQSDIYSLVGLVWPNTEELISRPFMGL